MTIEVKQMLVKSTVLQKQGAEAKGSNGPPHQDLEELKADILAECRQLLIEILREEKER